MSMIELTEGQPVSPDGLIMEWIDVPFGPFFPGLPGGLGLDMSLDGDSVAKVSAHSLVSAGELLAEGATPPEKFVERLAAMSPLSPVSYRQLACLALESAAKQEVASSDATARAAAVERERIASHLGWLANLGAQTGFAMLERRATNLELTIRDANMDHIAALDPEIASLLARLRKSHMLRDKLSGTGHIDHCSATSGPVARASGKDDDARSDDATYIGLGFATVTGSGGDAAARLEQRLAEIEQSCELIAKAEHLSLPEPAKIGAASGEGEAVVETPRGAARLTLTLTDGMVTAADIGTPTAAHFTLIEAITQHAEIADALIAVGSLDLSPWEMRP
ncbi:MAG: NADH-quinone oxidoreductase subunit D [Alphaproteobacteria bacterium]|nr:NADH-quinone oxidoreductase subunit D [Alphaproteobacteria bacterium]